MNSLHRQKVFLYISLLVFLPQFSIVAMGAKRYTNTLAHFLGTWSFKEGENVVYEEWHSVNDSVLAGKSYSVQVKSNGMNDTLVFETILLQQKGGVLEYIPTVHGQNEGKPVVFKAETVTKDSVVFSNPSHDFPQYISYSWRTPNTLFAAIWGSQSGKISRQEFKMERVKK